MFCSNSRQLGGISKDPLYFMKQSILLVFKTEYDELHELFSWIRSMTEFGQLCHFVVHEFG